MRALRDHELFSNLHPVYGVAANDFGTVGDGMKRDPSDSLFEGRLFSLICIIYDRVWIALILLELKSLVDKLLLHGFESSL